MVDWDLEWELENLCDQFASDGDEDAFLAGLESVMMVAGFTEDGDGPMDTDDFIETLSTAAHNANVGRSVGQLLGFE